MATTPEELKNSRTLQEYLDQNPNVERFEEAPRYFRDGDFLTHFFEDELCYAERIDQLLTIYTSYSNGRMVGFKIKGVTELLESVVSLIDIKSDEVQIILLILSAAGASSVRHAYYELGKRTGGLTLSQSAVRSQAA